MNLTNKKRVNKDLVLYENFIDADTAAKLIKILDKHAESGKLSWTPISFYETYSSVLPQDNDEDIIAEGLAPTIFSDMKQGIINAVQVFMTLIQRLFVKLDIILKNGNQEHMLVFILITQMKKETQVLLQEVDMLRSYI